MGTTRTVIDFAGVGIGSVGDDGQAYDFAGVHFGALQGALIVDFAGIRVGTLA